MTGSDGNTYYKVISDMSLKTDRTGRNVEAQYMPSRDYVYVKASDIQVVFTGSGKDTVIPDPEKVTELMPDMSPVEPEEPETPEVPETPETPETPSQPVVPEKTQGEVLSHLGVKNSSGYLTGFSLGSDVSALRNKITSYDGRIKVSIKDKNGTEVSSGILKTGMTVSVTTGGSTSNYSVVIRGDISGDGMISALDYVKVRNYLEGTTSLSGAYLKGADTSGDGNVSALDYVKVRNHLDKKSVIAQ